jgi:hypothetical protein
MEEAAPAMIAPLLQAAGAEQDGVAGEIVGLLRSETVDEDALTAAIGALLGGIVGVG